MEQDKYNCFGDSYIGTQGDENEVIHFIDDIFHEKIKMVTSAKSSPRTPSKKTKKNLKNVLK